MFLRVSIWDEEIQPLVQVSCLNAFFTGLGINVKEPIGEQGQGLMYTNNDGTVYRVFDALMPYPRRYKSYDPEINGDHVLVFVYKYR